MFISCLIVYSIDVAVTKIFLSKNGLYGGYMNIYLYEDGELIYDDGLIFKNGQPNRKYKVVFLITLF